MKTMMRQPDATIVSQLMEMRTAIPLNTQHPMIRHAGGHAGIGHRFSLESLKPFMHSQDISEDRCQLCGEGQNDGIHLLTECKDPKACSIREGLMPDEAWKEIRTAMETKNFDTLNEFINQADHSLANQDEKCVKFLEIHEPGNVMDVMARLLRPHLSLRGNRIPAELINRSGTVERQYLKLPEGVRPGVFQLFKQDMMTAYNWIGHITADLWKVYCSNIGTRNSNAEDEQDDHNDEEEGPPIGTPDGEE
jgi:hypothetical protein